jgi:hypothetical protein
MRKFLYLYSPTVHLIFFFKLPVALKCEHLALKNNAISAVYKFVIMLSSYPGSAHMFFIVL